MQDYASINGIMRDVVSAAGALWRERYESGKNVAYIFGDWPYIADTLTAWGKSPETSALKFPCVALYSPFTEKRGGENGWREATLSMLIMTNTRPEYDNETRERVSFESVLRPVYKCLLDALYADRRILKPYKGIVPHNYSENYRYGRYGVKAGDGKTFFDFVDAIEISNLQLQVRELCK